MLPESLTNAQLALYCAALARSGAAGAASVSAYYVLDDAKDYLEWLNQTDSQ